jgi:hypothetical protein
LENLFEILNRSTISVGDDPWFWKHDSSGYFSIKSAYYVLRRSTAEEVTFSEEETRLLPKVWKTWSPSKVAVFSWHLLQDRLSTRHNLWQRGVIGDTSASTCVLYGVGYESAEHLFASCSQISPVWYDILRWLGIELVPRRGILGLFEGFLGMGKSRKDRTWWLLIWHTIVWAIWNS